VWVILSCEVVPLYTGVQVDVLEVCLNAEDIAPDLESVSLHTE